MTTASRLAGAFAFATALALPVAAAAQVQGGADLSRAEFIAQMDGQFGAIDGNRDGTITTEEIEARRQILARSAALNANRQVFRQLDTDGNGALSQQEFEALVNPQAVSNVPVPTMQEFDTDRNGTITLVEYRIVTQGNFDRLDQDRDGVMTAAEMQAAGLPGA